MVVVVVVVVAVVDDRRYGSFEDMRWKTKTEKGGCDADAKYTWRERERKELSSTSQPPFSISIFPL